ncbi:MAG TPA: transglutaminase-like cysteine peptidase [Rhodocyclaceae bacterium]|nr:transglutaminase-like cysteine peptidase [Rhodocyclaceae bacterium]
MSASPITAPCPAAACLARPRRRRLLLALAASVLVGPLAGGVPSAHATPGLDRMQRLAAERYGVQAQTLVAAWRQLLEELAELEAFEQLTRVNTFFNRRIRFESDIDIWNEADHWATPLETMGRGAGDCEDFTIAKYMTLQLAGMPNERLRLIYVRAQIGRADSGISQAHMVLGYYPEPTAEPMILDNLVADIHPAARRPDLVPVFSFNSEGLWVGGASASSADPTARLSRWRDVLQRMREQGLT